MARALFYGCVMLMLAQLSCPAQGKDPIMMQSSATAKRIKGLIKDGQYEEALQEADKAMTVLERSLRKTGKKQYYWPMMKLAASMKRAMVYPIHTEIEIPAATYGQMSKDLFELGERLVTAADNLAPEERKLEGPSRILFEACTFAFQSNDLDRLATFAARTSEVLNEASQTEKSVNLDSMAYRCKLFQCYAENGNSGLSAFQEKLGPIIESVKDAPWACYDAMSLVYLVPELKPGFDNFARYGYYKFIEAHVRGNPDPTVSTLYVQLGNAAQHLGLLDDARRWYEAYFARNPKAPDEIAYVKVMLSVLEKEREKQTHDLMPSTHSLPTTTSHGQ